MFQLYPEVISYNTRNSIIISLIAIALTIVIISYNVYILHYRKNRMLTQLDELKQMEESDSSVDASIESQKRHLFKEQVTREFAIVSLNKVHILLFTVDTIFSVYIVCSNKIPHAMFFYLLEIMVLQIMYLLNNCFFTKPFQYMGNLYYKM
ncbi:MAG: hypothetical protein UDD07_02230 [Lachnospiraceae bacterium]|jgi:hypothetical protein|nr:hypothetical protein [Lachnospiraceae bacterium]